MRIKAFLLTGSLAVTCISHTSAITVNVGFNDLTLEDWVLSGDGGIYYDEGFFAASSAGGSYYSKAVYPFDPSTNPFFGPASLAKQIVLSPSDLPGGSGNMIVMTPEQVSPEPWASFEAPDGSQWSFSQTGINLYASKTIDLLAGDVVSGWSRFSTWDYPGYRDNAWAEVNGAILWKRNIDDLFRDIPVDPFGDWIGYPEDIWTGWRWKAPTSGLYTLVLGISGDDQMDSTGYHSEINIFRPIHNIPDAGSTGFMVVFAAIGLLALKRYR